MKIYREIPENTASSAIALGFFDGLHLAHRAVIRAAVEQKKNGLIPTVFTFGERPVNKQDTALLSPERKLAMLAELGVEQVVMPPFSGVKDLSAEAFFEKWLKNGCRAAFLSCGYDYRFGSRAAGNVTLLDRLCQETGIRLSVLPKLTCDGVTVSTTAIRQLLQEGRVEEANRLLGYPFSITGPVIHGRRLGHTLGFPTANQALEPGIAVPRFGVYTSRAEVDGVWYRGVTNVGIKPTVSGQSEPLAETHLVGYTGDLYGKPLRVELLRFLRPETAFSSLEELRSAIAADLETCTR